MCRNDAPSADGPRPHHRETALDSGFPSEPVSPGRSARPSPPVDPPCPAGSSASAPGLPSFVPPANTWLGRLPASCFSTNDASVVRIPHRRSALQNRHGPSTTWHDESAPQCAETEGRRAGRRTPASSSVRRRWASSWVGYQQRTVYTWNHAGTGPRFIRVGKHPYATAAPTWRSGLSPRLSPARHERRRGPHGPPHHLHQDHRHRHSSGRPSCLDPIARLLYQGALIRKIPRHLPCRSDRERQAEIFWRLSVDAYDGDSGAALGALVEALADRLLERSA